VQPIEWLTLVLVLVTGIYAWLTWHVVRESRLAREQQVRPHLKIETSAVGAGVLFPSVVSAGPGAALDVQVTLTARHRAGDGSSSVSIARPYMRPGEVVELFLPDPAGKEQALVTFEELSAAFASFRLHGSMRDVLGNEHTIEDRIDDVPAYLEGWGAVSTRATPDELKRTADAVRRIADSLKPVSRELRELRRQLEHVTESVDELPRRRTVAVVKRRGRRQL
jgi:hypothetical protein